ncbi:Neur-chan-LBD domain-containing protein [Aphelenchoides fujianensis]|nr:Neur-chan-LBD domain-containing protein [Aphelenchoides fujianensis]
MGGPAGEAEKKESQLLRRLSALEAQLYEDLLYSYNKIPRPVFNSSEVLMVDMGACLDSNH